MRREQMRRMEAGCDKQFHNSYTMASFGALLMVQALHIHPKRRNSMKANIGGTDRILRIVLGIVLIALAVTGVIGWWGWLGVVPLVTGLVRFCPLYPLLGMNTCPLEQRKPD